MTLHNIELDTALASLEDLSNTNPKLKAIAKFVIADDQPNGNNWLLPYTEFQNIIDTAIGMPVKMRFDGFGIKDHPGSVPIGAITKIEEDEVDGVHRLIAEASLWVDEFPEEIQFLKNKLKEKKPPGISYEIIYNKETSKIIEGIQNFKDTRTAAVTFVRVPSYGKRTPLLALASQKNLTDLEVIDGAVQMINGWTKDFNGKKGGQDMDHEEELKKTTEALTTARAEATSLTEKIAELEKQLVDKDGEILKRDEEIGKMQRTALVDTRTRKFIEAGFSLDADTEKADKKKQFFAAFSTDEGYEEYLADLVTTKTAAASAAPANEAAAAYASAKASLRNNVELPKVGAEDSTFDSMLAQAKYLARPNSV